MAFRHELKTRDAVLVTCQIVADAFVAAYIPKNDNLVIASGKKMTLVRIPGETCDGS